MSATGLELAPSGVSPTRAQRLAAWASEKATAGRQFTAGQYTITLVDDLTCAVTPANRVSVTMNLRVERAGVDVTPPGLNPVTLVNPPLYVREPDGTLTLSPARALRAAVIDLLRTYA